MGYMWVMQNKIIGCRMNECTVDFQPLWISMVNSIYSIPFCGLSEERKVDGKRWACKPINLSTQNSHFSFRTLKFSGLKPTLQQFLVEAAIRLNLLLKSKHKLHLILNDSIKEKKNTKSLGGNS